MSLKAVCKRLTCAVAAATLSCAGAQQIQLGDVLGEPAARRQHVEIETATVQVKAGHPDWVELQFRIDPGLHINSHTPHDELLVPTVLNLEASEQAKVLGQEYPAGIPLRLEVGGGETLSTYQGEFRVRLHVLAGADTQLSGVLRYQACDARSCFPPKNLPVHVSLTTR